MNVHDGELCVQAPVVSTVTVSFVGTKPVLYQLSLGSVATVRRLLVSRQLPVCVFMLTQLPASISPTADTFKGRPRG